VGRRLKNISERLFGKRVLGNIDQKGENPKKGGTGKMKISSIFPIPGGRGELKIEGEKKCLN